MEMVTKFEVYKSRKEVGDLRYKTEDQVLHRLLEYHRDKDFTGIIELAALSNILGVEVHVFVPDRSKNCLVLKPEVTVNPKPLSVFFCVGDEGKVKNLGKKVLKDDEWRRIQDEDCEVNL